MSWLKSAQSDKSEVESKFIRRFEISSFISTKKFYFDVSIHYFFTSHLNSTSRRIFNHRKNCISYSDETICFGRFTRVEIIWSFVSNWTSMANVVVQETEINHVVVLLSHKRLGWTNTSYSTSRKVVPKISSLTIHQNLHKSEFLNHLNIFEKIKPDL